MGLELWGLLIMGTYVGGLFSPPVRRTSSPLPHLTFSGIEISSTTKFEKSDKLPNLLSKPAWDKNFEIFLEQE